MEPKDELLSLVIRELNKEQKKKITSELIRRCRHFEQLSDSTKEEIASLGFEQWWDHHYKVLSLWNVELARAIQSKIGPIVSTAP